MAIDPNNIITIRVGELPPTPPVLGSKIPHEIGADLNYFTISQLVTFLQPYIGTFQHEVKILHVDAAYIAANFDNTGLGKNICLGWAIMNGQNGTDNVDGTFSMAYGASNSTIGLTGGLKEVTLGINQMAAHEHLNGVSDDIANVFVYGGTTQGMPGLATTDLDTGGSSKTYQGKTSQVGGGQPHENRPPFRVELHIIKL